MNQIANLDLVERFKKNTLRSGSQISGLEDEDTLECLASNYTAWEMIIHISKYIKIEKIADLTKKQFTEFLLAPRRYILTAKFGGGAIYFQQRSGEFIISSTVLFKVIDKYSEEEIINIFKKAFKR